MAPARPAPSPWPRTPSRSPSRWRRPPATSKGLGANCTAATDCGSGFCTDGVCCQEACKADVVCASCALTNTKGLCAPYAANTDPEKECVGFSMATGTGGSAGKGGAAGRGRRQDRRRGPDGRVRQRRRADQPARRRHHGDGQLVRRHLQRHEGLAPSRRREPPAASPSATRARIWRTSSATARGAAASASRTARTATPATSRARTAAPPAAPTSTAWSATTATAPRTPAPPRRPTGSPARRTPSAPAATARRQRRGRLLQHRLRLAQQLQQLRLGRQVPVPGRHLRRRGRLPESSIRTPTSTGTATERGRSRRDRQGRLRRHAAGRLRGRQHRLRRQGRQRPPGPDGLLRYGQQGDRHLRLRLRRDTDEGVPGVPGRQLHVLRSLLGLWDRSQHLQLLRSDGVVGLSPRGRASVSRPSSSRSRR